MNIEQLEFELNKLGTSPEDVYHIHCPSLINQYQLHNTTQTLKDWFEKHNFECKFILTGGDVTLEDI